MASNVGSVATITGNPQNIMIGSFSHIPYTEFSAALAPVALVGLLLTIAKPFEKYNSTCILKITLVEGRFALLILRRIGRFAFFGQDDDAALFCR